MPPLTIGLTFASARRKTSVAFLSLGLVWLLAQPAQAQQQPGPLSFFKNYFITGDYAVGGASLWRQGSVDGKAVVQISVTGVPEGADILAAYLYVQTAETAQWSGIDHATFNGSDLGPGSNSLAKALNWDLATTPCWTVAYPGGRRLVTYRADVLRFLPVGPYGKLVVGRVDGTNILPAVQVGVPDSGAAFGEIEEGGTESGGGTGPRAIGASLVVVYRDPAMPFKAVVLYDGGAKKTAFSTMDQTIAGFYQASASPAARMTHIVGDGRSGLSERVLLNGQVIATNPFVGEEGPKWDNPTFDNLPVPAGASSAEVSVTRNGLLSDCLCYSGIVFSTNVADADGDGLLDVWESSTTTLYDPNGQPLPNLAAMGADKDVRDLFIEIGYMETLAPATYGGVSKPAHSHLPTQAALELVGDAFLHAPTPIRVHFDVGASYPEGTPNQEKYIIRAPGLARGGDAIAETITQCTRLPGDPPWVCQFSEYPGTVGWKTGFRFLRDEVFVTPTPPVTNPPTPLEDYCGVPGYTCDVRFDRNRKDTFRYALFAHALGLPKSEDPADPGFHVPRTNTGVGDFPGGDVMVTLGAFADLNGALVDHDLDSSTADVWTPFPVGTPFMQASTLMHELGHNMERRHGGGALEPNCKPTYLSVMNYLYQLRGLLDDSGKPNLDFSGTTSGGISEASLSDGPWGGFRYRLGWYAPLAGSYLDGKGTAAQRHCDGSDYLPSEPLMVRIDARTAAGEIDWNADGVTADSPFSLDINFNGRIGDALDNADDWSNILLNQIGARRNPGGVYADFERYLFVGPMSLDSGRGDLGRGDLGRGDLGRGDLGRGDLGRGDLGRGDLGRGDLGSPGRGDLGRGDLGRGDLGGGDLFVGDPDNPGGELDFETATDLARTPPNEFTATITANGVLASWKAPNIGGVTGYRVYRVPGNALLPGQAWDPPVEAGITEVVPGTYTLIDEDALYGTQYIYFAVAIYDDEIQSDPSNLVPVTTPRGASTVTVNCPVTVIYTGAALEPCSALVTGPGGLNLTATPTHANNINAGPASASYTFPGDAHYEGSTGVGGFTIARATPVFSALSGPTISVGTTPTVLAGTLTSGTLVPSGTVSITLNGVNQPAAISATGTFSASFATGALTTTGSPYTITYSYAGDANFTAAGPDTSKGVTVQGNYVLVGVKVLPPATCGTFKPSSSGTLVDLEWKFTRNGVVVNSADALPVVTVTGPGGYSKTYSAGAGCVAANACSSFSYKTSDNKWDVHWQPKSAAVGTYYVVVTSQKTGQRFPETGPGFPVVFRK